MKKRRAPLPDTLQPAVWTLLTEALISDPSAKERALSGEFEALYEALGFLFKAGQVSPWYALLAWDKKRQVASDNYKIDNPAIWDFHLDHIVGLLISSIPLDMHEKNREEPFRHDHGTTMMMAVAQLNAGPCIINALSKYGERFSHSECWSGAASRAVSLLAPIELLVVPPFDRHHNNHTDHYYEDQPHTSYFKTLFSSEALRSQLSNSRIDTEQDGGTLLHMVCRHSRASELPIRIRFLIQIMQVNPSLPDDRHLGALEIVVRRLQGQVLKDPPPLSLAFFTEAIRLLEEASG